MNPHLALVVWISWQSLVESPAAFPAVLWLCSSLHVHLLQLTAIPFLLSFCSQRFAACSSPCKIPALLFPHIRVALLFPVCLLPQCQKLHSHLEGMAGSADC